MRAILLSFLISVMCLAANPASAATATVGWSSCGQLLPCWNGPYSFGVIASGETKSVDLTLDASAWPVNIVTPFGTDGSISTYTYEIAFKPAPFNSIIDLSDPASGWNITDTADGWNVSVTNNGQAATSLGPLYLFADLYVTIRLFEIITQPDGNKFVLTPSNSIFGVYRFAEWTTPELATVPLPAALPLFIVGLAGLGFVGWRKRCQ